MSPAIVSLLAVTFGFAALVLWVYWPSNKNRMESFGSIPLRDEAPAQAPQKEIKK
jgi:cbb3-type cytochrome oxidase subunit 3